MIRDAIKSIALEKLFDVSIADIEMVCFGLRLTFNKKKNKCMQEKYLY